LGYEKIIIKIMSCSLNEEKSNRKANVGKYNSDMELDQELVQNSELSYLPIIGLELQNPKPIYNNIEIKKLDYVELKKFDEEIHISFFEKAVYYTAIVWKMLKIILPILPYLITIWNWYNKTKNKLKEQNMFKDPKTTWIGIIGAIAMLLKVIFKIDIPAEIQEAFVAIIIFLLGLFSSDSQPKQE